MKLYNRTRIGDAVLAALLRLAGRSVGARVSGVVVQVNPGRTHARGTAYECFSARIGGRWIATDGGMFKISLPLCLEPMVAAEIFLETARHEFAHIRDYQTGGRYKREFSRASRSGRRPAHDTRPEEIRAEDMVWESDRRLKRGHFDEALLALAVEVERVQREHPDVVARKIAALKERAVHSRGS